MSNQGALSIRASTTFGMLATSSWYGMAPPECHRVERRRTLAVTNEGGPVDSHLLPSVTFVDVTTRGPLEKREAPDRDRNSGRLAVADNQEFAVASVPGDGLPAETRLGVVSLRRRDQRAATPPGPTESNTRSAKLLDLVTDLAQGPTQC